MANDQTPDVKKTTTETQAPRTDPSDPTPDVKKTTTETSAPPASDPRPPLGDPTADPRR